MAYFVKKKKEKKTSEHDGYTAEITNRDFIADYKGPFSFRSL